MRTSGGRKIIKRRRLKQRKRAGGLNQKPKTKNKKHKQKNIKTGTQKENLSFCP